MSNPVQITGYDIAHLTPDALKAMEDAKTWAIYISVASTSVLIYDILWSLKADRDLLARYRFNIPVVSYLIAKFSTLTFSVIITYLLTSSRLYDCGPYLAVVIGLYTVSASFTSLLFYFRLLGVYSSNKYIVIAFGVLWLLVPAGCLVLLGPVLVPRAPGAIILCMIPVVGKYVSAALAPSLANDLLVFIAITYKMMTLGGLDGHSRTYWQKLTGSFSGEYLPAFSRGFLQESQIFFFVAVSIHLTTWVVLGSAYQNAFNPRSIGVVPCLVIVNIMASRMFRQLHREPPVPSNNNLRHTPQVNVGLHTSRSRASSSARTLPLHHSSSREKMVDIEDAEPELEPMRSGRSTTPTSGRRRFFGLGSRGGRSYIGDISNAVEKDVIEIQVMRTVEMSRL